MVIIVNIWASSETSRNVIAFEPEELMRTCLVRDVICNAGISSWAVDADWESNSLLILRHLRQKLSWEL
jgi:hypothetical protein